MNTNGRLFIPLLIYTLICGFSTLPATATDVNVTGMWAPTIGENDLVAGAGSNLSGSYQSNFDQLLLNVYNTLGSNWRVDVRRSDTHWIGQLLFSIKRSGNGSGGGSIYGGITYQSVDTFDGSFFTGMGDRNDITIQLILDGISVQTPPDTYSTTLVFTVVDI